MSNDLDHRLINDDLERTTSEAGAFVFDDALRGGIEWGPRDRASLERGPLERGSLERGPRDRASDGTASPAAGRAKLRRWSVAELIARAVPRPPAGGVAR